MLKNLKKLVKRVINRNAGNQIQKEEPQKVVNFPGGVTHIDQTREEDIFIVGFPKSGNTLMQHMIANLYYGLNEESSRTMINLMVPDIYANKHYFRFNDTCFFKSHERPKPHYKKVIYVMRDGREALLSYYYMLKNMGKTISLEDIYSGKVDIFGGSWSDHINEWEENPFGADILWVKFEDIKGNKMGVLQEICAFLDITRSQAELEKVVQLTSFEHMKELEARADWEKMKINVGFNIGSFVRKGAVDSYTKEVPEHLVRAFEEKSTNNFYRFTKSNK